MRSSKLFGATIRSGVRVGRPTVVVHASRSATPEQEGEQVKVGFVVSKQVGNAVTRNRVKRQLRHLVASRLPDTPAGVSLVVRALPAAAVQPDRLARDLDEAWRTSLHRLEVRR